MQIANCVHAFKFRLSWFCDDFSPTLVVSNNMILLQFGVISTYKYFKDYKLHLPYGIAQFQFCVVLE